MSRRPPKNKARQALDTVAGGRHLDVILRNGRAERVFVYQIPMRFFDLFIAHELDGSYQDLVELCIGRHPAWDKKFAGMHPADKYTPESLQKLFETAHEINFPAALQHIERKKNSMGGLEPMIKRLYAAQADMMKEAMEGMMKHMVASALSSLPPSAASGATTPNSGTGGASSNSSSRSSSTTPTAASTPRAPSTPPTTQSPPLGAGAAPSTRCDPCTTAS